MIQDRDITFHKSEYSYRMYYILTTKVNALRAYNFLSQHLVTKRRVLTLHKISPWLDIHVIQKVIKKVSHPLSLPSYVLGGSMSPAPENDVPNRVSQCPIEIC